jgi:hypothetical protein
MLCRNLRYQGASRADEQFVWCLKRSGFMLPLHCAYAVACVLQVAGRNMHAMWKSERVANIRCTVCRNSECALCTPGFFFCIWARICQNMWQSLLLFSIKHSCEGLRRSANVNTAQQ